MKTNGTRYAILGLLSEGPMSGYEIKKTVERRFRFFWSESFGQIYPQLRAMQALGLVTSRSADPGRGSVRYALTGRGRKELREWLSSPAQTENVRLELLLKLFFGDQAEPGAMERAIEAFRRRHADDLATIESFRSGLATQVDEHANHPYILLVIEFGVGLYRSYLDWCENTVAKLRAMRARTG